MNKRLSFIIDALKKEYPDAVCSLEYEQPHELLFSTRLSAQCTDARVNIVAKDLYARYRTLEDFANADLEELESYHYDKIKSEREGINAYVKDFDHYVDGSRYIIMEYSLTGRCPIV